MLTILHLDDKNRTKGDRWRGQLHNFNHEIGDVAFAVLGDTALRSDEESLIIGE